jgi:ribosome biogenesis GTPase A
MQDKKSNINWYPGHMEKARRDMQDSLKAADMIIEIRDARIPYASSNPLLDKMIQNKPRLIVLSKKDLADETITKEFIEKYSNEDNKVIAVDLQNDSSAKNSIINASKELTKSKRDKMIAKGIKPRAMRAMICGIPNVGKSTLINRIVGKNKAKTADKPGVTRSLTWIHTDEALDLLDTPGVLWPKFDNQHMGCLLAATGAINEDILDLKSITNETIEVIRDYYPGVLENEYGFQTDTDIHEVLTYIAKKRNLVKDSDTLDIDRAAILFLREYRRGKLGKFTLERIDEEN